MKVEVAVLGSRPYQADGFRGRKATQPSVHLRSIVATFVHLNPTLPCLNGEEPPGGELLGLCWLLTLSLYSVHSVQFFVCFVVMLAVEFFILLQKVP